MNRPLSAAGSLPPFIELLEPRIAPAVINAGPTAFGGQDYDDAGTPFKEAYTAAVDAGDPAIFTAADTSHFFLDLKAGDTLRIYNDSASFTDFIKVSGGRAFAFFFDKNGDFIPQADELTGLVLSDRAKLSVNGAVDGDILATLNAKTGTFSTNDLISTSQNISGLTISGDVNGSIIAGGSLSAITVSKVESVKSGLSDLAGYDFNFGGTGAGVGVGEGHLAQFDPGTRMNGGSLRSITVGSADFIMAGNGGAGAAGGSITGLTVIADSNGLHIAAGNGGDGMLGRTNGGLGGKISNVVFQGTVDSTQGDLIQVHGGAGGQALLGSTSAGGHGGTVDSVWVGYEYSSARKIIESPNTLFDQVGIYGGEGGHGVTAGNGGNVSKVSIISAPDDVSLTSEITIQGGHGGDLLGLAKRAGKGGSVSTFQVQNLDYDGGLGTSSTLIAGGHASAWDALLPSPGTKADGGSVSNAALRAGATPYLLGQDFQVLGGSGSSTEKSGGHGGSISNLSFGADAGLFLVNLDVKAGDGGFSTTGSAGNGGSFTGLDLPIARLANLSLEAGAGGTSLGDGTRGGSGGKGGNLGGINLFDADSISKNDIVAHAGDGGDGFRGGGIGGSLSQMSIFGGYASLSALAGDGGSSLGLRGNGAHGGSISGVAFAPKSAAVDQSADLTAGSGGNASGAGKAGSGGSISNSNVQATALVSFVAGRGGDTEDRGTSGSGGSLGSSSPTSGIFAKSAKASVSFVAGDAGGILSGAPARGGLGGSITNAVGSASLNIEFLAGDGLLGGHGGSISKVAFYGSGGAGDAPDGDLYVVAGQGGDAVSSRSSAGRGGSITTAVGFSSQIALADSLFLAGDGGDGGRAGIGGSLSGVLIYGGAAPISIVAGHGGNGASSGGVGGNVSQVAVNSGVLVQAIAAGDGGSTDSGKGANGGSVSSVNVAGDIGIRSGTPFGFATDGSRMGGIFAGKAGINTATPLDAKTTGLAGSVSSVTASSIAAIVAGRGDSPFLANKVDGIYLAGNQAATVNPAGDFTNFPTANFVGGKAGDPTLAGADEFHFVGGGTFAPSGNSFAPWALGTTEPLDGLVAALTLTSNRNFTPLAFLTNTADSTSPPVYGLYVPTVSAT